MPFTKADPVDGHHHHRGFVKLKGDHLPQSQKVKNSDEMIYGVSMLHQLHCLVRPSNPQLAAEPITNALTRVVSVKCTGT